MLASIISALIALAAAWFSLRSASEARRANDIGRLNAMISLRSHYLELMKHEASLVDSFRDIPSGMRAIQTSYAELDGKLSEVVHEIEKCHAHLIRRP